MKKISSSERLQGLHNPVANCPPVCINISFTIVVLGFQFDKSLLKVLHFCRRFGTAPPAVVATVASAVVKLFFKWRDEQTEGGVPDLHRSIKRAVVHWKQNRHFKTKSNIKNINA
ncbi:hypothetical protein PoB_000508900 [Plakobranchus ocellatus]|uniref:Uncharacterized protein n=1 Tax=Plakobranchus ocellatus TaxID=259542 RepID=A0AAV3Y6N0_9GAST|nr:hypothetical protein PoB_000508900 [Plakobranchus ocellatus]